MGPTAAPSSGVSRRPPTYRSMCSTDLTDGGMAAGGGVRCSKVFQLGHMSALAPEGTCVDSHDARDL